MTDPAAAAPPRAAVVVLAGGSGTRVGATVNGAAVNKVYLPLAGRPVIAWSLAAAGQVPGVRRLIVVARPEDGAQLRRILDDHLPGLEVTVVPGGPSRHRSEAAALAHLAPAITADELDVIAVHDGARPLADATLFRQVIATAAAVGGALPALPAPGLVPAGDQVMPVGALVRVQTPQAFRAAALLAAFTAADAAGYEGTDTASSVEAFGALPVRAVPGSRTNLKVTYPHDLAAAEGLLRKGPGGGRCPT